MVYDILTADFDIKKHAFHYPHYLEIVIFPDGKIEYAIPSHQEKLIAICCRKLNISRDELSQRVPKEYWLDMITWLCTISGRVSVWTDFYMKSDKNPITADQLKTLKMLKFEGVYEGEIND